MIPDADFSLLGSLLKLGLAFVLALPLGWEQASRSKSAGMRTYPLIAVGACAMLLAGQRSMTEDPRDQADVYFGLITGIGFIGSGAMMKDPGALRGMAAAVSLWVAAAMGAAVAYGMPVVAVALCAAILLTLRRKKRVP